MIKTNAKILWVGRKRAGSPDFLPGLEKKDYQVTVVSTGKDAIEKLKAAHHDVAVVYAASLRTSGTRICQSLCSQKKKLPIILIIEAGQQPPEKTDANVVLVLPFTIRKLINRITPFEPIEGDHLIIAGNIHLDTERLQVRCDGRETRLTPRMVRLLSILLDHPGEVLERNNLFSEVWETDFTDDTRTLDVHISWLRQALEENPRKPKYLKTLRGVGYRLDV
jgi:DNA-binding response OmpR family regulator